MIKFAFWTVHPGDILGEPIQFLTHGCVSHFAFLFTDQAGQIWVAEAYWPKYRIRKLLDAEKPNIEAFVLKNITPGMEFAIRAEIDKLLLAPPEYSGWDLVRFAFNDPDPSENQTFCSRVGMHICMKALPPAMWPQRRVQGGDWLSPRDLYISNLLQPCTVNN